MDDMWLSVLHSASLRGIKATVAEQIYSWQAEQSNVNLNNKDPEREAGIVPYARIGLGLPMSNIFTTYVVLGWCLHNIN
jgi:pyruvate dehydrogenase kinase 2/3/4